MVLALEESLEGEWWWWRLDGLGLALVVDDFRGVCLVVLALEESAEGEWWWWPVELEWALLLVEATDDVLL